MKGKIIKQINKIGEKRGKESMSRMVNKKGIGKKR